VVRSGACPVAAVADQQDLVVVAREPGRLAMHLGDERAGRVDGVEATVGRALHDGRRDAVRAEDDVGALRNLDDVIHKDGTAFLEGRYDVDVVHDLLADIDGSAEFLEGLLDRDHGTVHSRTVSARGREQYSLGPRDGVVP
jgi:hypothetical protein